MTIYSSLGVGSGGGGGAFAPNTTIQEFDDFLSSSQQNTYYTGKLQWGCDNNNMQLAPGEAGHDGIIVGSDGNTPQGLQFSSWNANSPFLLGSGELSVNWVFKLTALSVGGARYFAQIGLGDSDNLDEFDEGCYFNYEDDINSGNWVLKTANGGSRTSVNTAIPADTEWHNFGVVINTDASLVTYYMDGVSVGTIATDIPTAAVTAHWNVFPNGGTAPLHKIDLFYYTRIFTTAR